MMNTCSLRPLATNDLLSVAELSREEVESLLATAQAFKRNPAEFRQCLSGRTLTMLFEKPSLRTRVSFELGFAKLGGQALYIDHQGSRIGDRESAADCAKNLERWTDVIVARTFDHKTVQEMADAANIPVINALSDRFHPCQALADVLTLAELFPYRGWGGMSLAYVGDGNNVCHSLMLICAILGIRFTVITPPGYEPNAAVEGEAQDLAIGSGADITVTNDLAAVSGHQVIYTDTWISMGNEDEAKTRMEAFSPYQINEELLMQAGPNTRVMHCLPAKRGSEITSAVIDSDRSVVFDQAENRMHAQNALLLHLLMDKNRTSSDIVVWPDMVGAL